MQQGTIAPLHIRYRAHALTYPMRITADNPGISHMDLYVAKDKIKWAPGFEDQRFVVKAQNATSYAVVEGPPGATPSTEAPTLRKLLGSNVVVHHLTANLAQADRSQDLVFAFLKPGPVGAG